MMNTQRISIFFILILFVENAHRKMDFSSQIEHSMITLTITLTFLNQSIFQLVSKQMENCQYHHIVFNLAGNKFICVSVLVTLIEYLFILVKKINTDG